MAGKRGNLGRGLSALLGSQAVDFANLQASENIQEILVENIRPNRYRMRQTLNNDSMKELAESIRAYGVLQPIIVRNVGGEKYELIAGERRLSAARFIGLEKIPAVVRDYTDSQMREVSLIENIQRQDLSVLEEAATYESLMNEYSYTQETLAAKVGRSRSHIANLLRLLKLSPQVRDWISEGKLSMGQARPLLAIENEELQVNAAEMIIHEDLSVRKVEAFIKELRNAGLIPEEKKSDLPKVMAYAIMPSRRTISNRISEQISEQKIDSALITQNRRVSPYESRFRDAERKLTKFLNAPIKIIEDGNNHQLQINLPNETELLRVLTNIETALTNSQTKEIDFEDTSRAEKISALRNFSTKGTIN